MKLQPKHKWIWILTAVLLSLLISCGRNEIPGETESSAGETMPVTAETETPFTEFPHLTLSGSEITEFTFRCGDFVNPEAVQFFADYLSAAFGMTEGENGVVFDLSVAVKMAKQANVAVDGNIVTVNAGSNGGLAAVMERIMECCSAQIEGNTDADAPVSVSLESCLEATYTYTLFESEIPPESCTLTAHTDKDPTSYAVGEEIKFYFELVNNGETVPCSEFRYSITTDSGFRKTLSAPGEDGKFYFSYTLTEPGYIEVKITARGNKPTESGAYYIASLCDRTATACANFDEIGTAYEEPGDFDAFWASLLAKLDGIDLGDTVITEYLPGSEYGKDGYRVYHVEVPTNKDPAIGFISLPIDAEPASLGIRMHFIGYGNGKAGPAANPNAISFNVCAHSIPCDVDQETFDQEFLGRNLYGYGLDRSDYSNPSNAYFANMILRNVQALRFAETFPEWDGKNVYAAGMSQGAFQSVALAALCPEVSELYLEIPWMCNVGMNHAGQIPSTLIPTYSRNLLYFDSVFFARRVTGIPVNIKVGMADPIAPVTGTTALYNNFKGCDKTITLYQSVGHGGWSSKSQGYVKSSSAE